MKASRPRGPGRRSAVVALSAVALSAAACQITLDDVVSQARVPGTGSKAVVELEARRFGYLDARVKTGTYKLRFFLPANVECESLFRTEEKILYQNLGPLGRLKYGEDVICEPVGILGLRTWRDRRPRPRSGRQVVPRAQAVFDEIDRDDDLILLEGRFPLAGAIGWVGGVASRALVSNDENCREAVASGVASMEFRKAGRTAFALVGARGLCLMEGFVQP